MFHLADTVQMRKPHACGENHWEIMRMGADIRIKCLKCGHVVMMPRMQFDKKFKKVVTKANDPANDRWSEYVGREKMIVPNVDQSEE